MEVTGQDLVVPGSGEIVDLNDEIACCRALQDLAELERLIEYAKRELVNAVAERSRVLGTKTITLPSGVKAQIGSEVSVVYDAEAIEEGLREAGMPEDRIREIVLEDISHKVKAVEAKRAASANPAYAAVIDANRQEVSKKPSVSFRRR